MSYAYPVDLRTPPTTDQPVGCPRAHFVLAVSHCILCRLREGVGGSVTQSNFQEFSDGPVLLLARVGTKNLKVTRRCLICTLEKSSGHM